MEQLVARTVVDDMFLHNGRSKKELDRYITMNLARNLADELIKHNLDEITVKREWNFGDPRIQRPGGTEYIATLFLLTKDEMLEFEDLKKFKKHMKEFVN